MREEFEAWAAEESEIRGVGETIGLMTDEHSDCYSMIWTQTAWMAWQAARASIKTVTQPQGEPVAWIKEHWSGKHADFHYKSLADVVFKEDWKPLYAEQPAPVSATYMEQLDPFIGDMPITHIDDDALAPYIRSKLKPESGRPVTNRTVNIALQRVIRVLNLCARKWRDEERHPWLDTVPMISLLDEKTNSRKPYPLSWEEQSILFAELPAHLQTMAMFKVNTGCREQEVCKLQWDWEIAVPELGASVFLIPASFGGRSARAGVKNRDERLVVLNDVAKSVIEKQRGKHPLFVFPFGKPDEEGKKTTVHRMNDSAWKKARVRAAKKWQEKYFRPAHDGFARIRIHDLKHTFGRRLRAAGVTEEDRKALLGHKNGSITSHYSAAELDQLIEAANKVSATDSRAPALTILKRRQA